MAAPSLSRILRTILFILIVAVVCASAQGKVIYVDDNAIGANNGTSWADAYPCLRNALADAAHGDEIRVAQGIYQPDRRFIRGRFTRIEASGDRTATFQLINGVVIKGAYAGFGESDPNVRNVELYETILSGDLNGNDVQVADPCDLLTAATRAENSYHVVTGRGTNESAVLDGLAITGGNANILSADSPYAYGGGMYNEDGSPFLTNCTFIGNSANDCGGGIYNLRSHPVLQNCTFVRNYTGWDGGGIFNHISSPQLKDCTFEYNQAYGSGGGVHNYENSDPILTNCVFNANSTGNIGAGGGAANRIDSSPEFIGCTFIRNSALWGGGGVDNYEDFGTPAKYIDCTFIENTGRESGGGMSNCESCTIVTRCEFSGNRTDGMGGAIINGDNSQPILTDCLFYGNSANGGGAIQNWFGACPQVIRCTFTGNTAGWAGGAILDSNSVTTMTNCLFSNNLANGGGVIFFDNCIGSTIANCTFAGNTALYDGDAVLCNSDSPSHVKFTNCIIWDESNEIWNNDGSVIELTYTNIQGGQAGVYDPCNAVIWGKGNIDTDPLFANPGYWAHREDPNVAVEPNDPNAVWIDGDYHLKSEAGRWDPVSESWVLDDVTSPCIDAGDPNYLITPEDTDLDGHPRIVGELIDMGVYEHRSDASPDPNQETKGPAPNGVQSLAVYEDRIGEPGLLIEDANLQMWVPKRHEEHARVIFQYFADGYGVMSELFGGHDMPVQFSIEHYPVGSSFFWGGTDGQGTIRYSYTNLEDDYPEWNLYHVPHVVGYYEEMAHCFARDIGIRGERSVGYYETLGMMIGQETAMRAAWNPYIESFINTNHEQNADTTLHYQFNGGQCNVQENICLTRILAHAFKTEVIDKYGWDSLAAAFGEVIREGYPLRDYDCSHTWGGFLSYVGRITGTDLGAIFGGEYGLPWMIWQSVEHIGADQYRFRVTILDLQGSQPVDVRLHLYGDFMAYATTHDMLATGGGQGAGWFYEVTLQIDEPEGCQYAFSANDGMYDVFQAVGQPTVMHPIGYADNANGANNGSN